MTFNVNSPEFLPSISEVRSQTFWTIWSDTLRPVAFWSSCCRCLAATTKIPSCRDVVIQENPLPCFPVVFPISWKSTTTRNTILVCTVCTIVHPNTFPISACRFHLCYKTTTRLTCAAVKWHSFARDALKMKIPIKFVTTSKIRWFIALPLSVYVILSKTYICCEVSMRSY